MYIVLGATGHVGSAVAQSLLERNNQVTVVVRDVEKGREWEGKGAKVAVVDIHDTERLRAVFQQGQRLFVLNPPAPITTDTALEERQSAASILAALTDSNIEKIVVQSTYGAQPGEQIGDLSVLYELEQGLIQTGIPTSVVRGAYYMSNWDMALETARETGQVHALYPPDFKLPMVAPQDLGATAARLLMEPVAQKGLHYMEGPEHYSPADVAAAFADALKKDVVAVQIPQETWVSSLQAAGFSEPAAQSMAAMTAITLDQKIEVPDSPIRGKITLQEYISSLATATGH